MEQIEHIINEVMQFYPEYRYRFDRNLIQIGQHISIMYPSKEIMQTISNRSVIENLQNHGDIILKLLELLIIGYILKMKWL